MDYNYKNIAKKTLRFQIGIWIFYSEGVDGKSNF